MCVCVFCPTCLEANILSMISFGTFSPVCQCPLTRARISFSQHQFSSACEGHSTKSLSVLVPEKRLYLVWPNTPCITWPNSWKNVSNSECRNTEGFSEVAFVKLHTIARTGYYLVRGTYTIDTHHTHQHTTRATTHNTHHTSQITPHTKHHTPHTTQT